MLFNALYHMFMVPSDFSSDQLFGSDIDFFGHTYSQIVFLLMICCTCLRYSWASYHSDSDPFKDTYVILSSFSLFCNKILQTRFLVFIDIYGILTVFSGEFLIKFFYILDLLHFFCTLFKGPARFVQSVISLHGNFWLSFPAQYSSMLSYFWYHHFHYQLILRQSMLNCFCPVFYSGYKRAFYS